MAEENEDYWGSSNISSNLFYDEDQGLFSAGEDPILSSPNSLSTQKYITTSPEATLFRNTSLTSFSSLKTPIKNTFINTKSYITPSEKVLKSSYVNFNTEKNFNEAKILLTSPQSSTLGFNKLKLHTNLFQKPIRNFTSQHRRLSDAIFSNKPSGGSKSGANTTDGKIASMHKKSFSKLPIPISNVIQAKFLKVVDGLIACQYIKRNHILDYKNVANFDAKKFHDMAFGADHGSSKPSSCSSSIASGQTGHHSHHHKVELVSEISDELYKSRSDKCALLDAALFRAEGNILLKTLLFCRNTLSRDNFYDVLQARPVATRAYIRFLKDTNDMTSAIEILTVMGQHKQALFLELDQIMMQNPIFSTKSRWKQYGTKCNSPNIPQDLYSSANQTDKSTLNQMESFIRQIMQCKTHCQKYITQYIEMGVENSTEYKELNNCLNNLNEYVSTLQMQYTLAQLEYFKYERSQSSQLTGNNIVANNAPKSLYLCLDSTLFDILVYAFTYYDKSNKDTVSLINPHSLSDEYKVNPNMFATALLFSLCHLGSWSEIESLFLSNVRLIQYLKIKATLSPLFIAAILQILHCPNHVIMNFINRIEDDDDRKRILSTLK